MTTNEMIYKTITTKLTKEPTYKSVLEDLGYEIYDSTWSSYNYWTVKNKRTGKAVLFSKGYDNKRRLYDIARPIETNDFKKVDYVDLLNKKRDYRLFEECGKYSKLRSVIRESKSMIRAYERWENEERKELEEITDKIKRYNKQKADYQNRLDNARNEVAELRR